MAAIGPWFVKLNFLISDQLLKLIRNVQKMSIKVNVGICQPKFTFSEKNMASVNKFVNDLCEPWKSDSNF